MSIEEATEITLKFNKKLFWASLWGGSSIVVTWIVFGAGFYFNTISHSEEVDRKLIEHKALIDMKAETTEMREFHKDIREDIKTLHLDNQTIIKALIDKK